MELRSILPTDHCSISVIIPAINEADRIAAAIHSAWAIRPLEVIVADGGSGDGTATIAQALAAQVVVSPAGRACQQNAGARPARGEVLLFLHADCRLTPDCGQQIMAHRSAAPDERAGAFRQRIDQPGWAYRAVESGNSARVRWLGMAYGDQAIWIERRLFQQLGGFASVPLMEDVILMRQLRRLTRLGLLAGPVEVDARRWQQRGVFRQTVRNWSLLAAFHLGVPPARLAAYYRRHDQAGVARRSG